MIDGIRSRATSVVLAAATALVIVGVSIAPFLSPAWVGFEQGRAEALAWTGYAPNQLEAATNAILHDLVLGPPAFDVAIDGQPVLTEAERSHMRDVRGVFGGGFALVGLAAVALLIGVGRDGDRVRLWRSVRRGAAGLAVSVVAIGAVAAVAFDQLFAAFHGIFFQAGTWAFDPARDRIVQLFPDRFWFESTIAVGIAIVAACLVVIWFARRAEGRAAGEVTTPVAAAGDPTSAAIVRPASGDPAGASR